MATQKKADEKTALAEQKLASVGKLEEENSRLKTALEEGQGKSEREDGRYCPQEERSGELSGKPC